MDENNRRLLDKHAVQFSTDLNLVEVIPILMACGLWRPVHQEYLNVINNCHDILTLILYRDGRTNMNVTRTS
jgi:hypothetical protein